MKKIYPLWVSGLMTFLWISFTGFSTLAQGYQWTEANEMMYPSVAHSACSTGGKIFAVGGTDKTLHNNEYGESWVQVFDPATNSWTEVAPMPTPRMMLGVASVNGIVYAIGGGYFGYLSSANEAYDPSTGVWTIKASKPSPGSSFGICVVNNKIYTVGGMKENNDWSTEVYDPLTDQWSTLPAMPHPVAGMACASVNGKIYVIGGVDLNYNGVNFLQVFDVTTNTWEYKQHMPATRFGAVAAVVGNKIYVFGGAVWPVNTATQSLYIYDITTNTWSGDESLPIPTQWAAIALSDDNTIYLSAGENKCMMTYPDAIVYKFLYKFKVFNLGLENPVGPEIIRVSPNPVSDLVLVNYSTANYSNVTLEMFNATGSGMKIQDHRLENRGKHEITVNMTGFAAGIYFLRITAEGVSAVRKILKVK
ncbi:MAG TPA: kelch repeat-containing protein [Bacteroidales bacterium]|nr:kelch repeat-containing protein [Bacteroidales bacterium]